PTNDDNRAAHASVIRLEPCALLASPENSSNARIAPLHNLFDTTLHTARGARNHHHPDAITMHRAADPIRSDINVVLPSRCNKAKSAGMHAEHALPTAPGTIDIST